MIEGLTYKEVGERKAKGETNHYAGHKTKTVREIFIENIFSLFNFIILGIIVFVLIFYFKLGDERLLLDSIGILMIAVINTFIGIYQEIRSKRALDKVSLLLKKKVVVVREGVEEEIEQKEVVADEVIKIVRGNQVVVDGVVLESSSMEIDESLLTGESVPIIKMAGDKVLSGSFCVSGAGFMRAEKIGAESYANSVTVLAKKYKFTVTPLQKKINLILKVLFGVAMLLVVVKILIGNGAESEADFVRDIATILISLVPQGLVLTASVTYALGVYRISKIGAIVQKLNAIESFSNVKVVCMDKTGTLTKNQLSICKLTMLNVEIVEEQGINSKIEQGVEKYIGTFAGLSTEKNATIKAMEKYEGFENAEKLSETPFSSETKMSKIEIKINGEVHHFVLGAYDLLIDECDGNFDGFLEKNGLEVYRNLLFGEEERINGKEQIVNSKEQIVNSIKEQENEREEVQGRNDKLKITPICVISISDTIREDVYEALKLFEKNGIEYKILSGDAPEAIQAILREIGIEVGKEKMVTGRELGQIANNKEQRTNNEEQITNSKEQITNNKEERTNSKKEQEEEWFNKVVREKFVFARLVPEDKLRIIKSLKRQKIYTAMIGDGVNDLPAIKEADMGIAMEEGSQITKEIADIVLLKNKFSLLPEIFNEGNKIVNSVSAVSKLFLTKNFMVIYLTLLSFFTMRYPITPRRVSLLNIFAIGIPALIISAKNKNISKNLNFVKDVFSYVIFASIVTVAGGYAGYYLSKLIINSNPRVNDMVMIAVMVFIAIANFLVVSKSTEEAAHPLPTADLQKVESGENKINEQRKDSKIYYLYAGIMAVVFMFFAATKINFFVLNYIKMFYEIFILDMEYWVIVLFISVIAYFMLKLKVSKSRR